MSGEHPSRVHGRWGFAQQELIAGDPLWRPYVVSRSDPSLHIPRPELFENSDLALIEVNEIGARIHR